MKVDISNNKIPQWRMAFTDDCVIACRDVGCDLEDCCDNCIFRHQSSTLRELMEAGKLKGDEIYE